MTPKKTRPEMMTALPGLADFEAFRTWRADASRWLPVALDIARSHGLKPATPHIFTTGTNLVIGLGDDLILKIFPPIYRGQFVRTKLAGVASRPAHCSDFLKSRLKVNATNGRISSLRD